MKISILLLLNVSNESWRLRYSLFQSRLWLSYPTFKYHTHSTHTHSKDKYDIWEKNLKISILLLLNVSNESCVRVYVILFNLDLTLLSNF